MRPYEFLKHRLRDFGLSLITAKFGFQVEFRFEKFCFALEAGDIEARAIGRGDEKNRFAAFDANVDAGDALLVLGFEALGDPQQRT